jgi:hypothetical protein
MTPLPTAKVEDGRASPPRNMLWTQAAGKGSAPPVQSRWKAAGAGAGAETTSVPSSGGGGGDKGMHEMTEEELMDALGDVGGDVEVAGDFT